ncbi:MAG: hydrogenase formation protein HypD [bacterium]
MSRIRKAVEVIVNRVSAGECLNIMEVCGTHTMAIAQMGIRELLGDKVRLVSGPGCPVCVTSDGDLIRSMALSEAPDVIVATFGDMVRVPIKNRSLFSSKAEGADVRIVYSPDDALKIAVENPGKRVVFLAVGFETTIPAIAGSIVEAEAAGITNYAILPMMKVVPPALRLLCEHPLLQIDGFILPGHVSAIIGTKPYGFVASEFGIPGVITGFTDDDIADGLLLLSDMISSGNPRIVNSYRRAVTDEGNIAAQRLIDKVFEPDDAYWRGIGFFPKSGLKLRQEYSKFDIREYIDLPDSEPPPDSRCRCGEVILGRILPTECPQFGTNCTSENPLGPCMVSSEGACAAYYKYRQ